MSNLVEYAKSELARIGKGEEKDEMQTRMESHILDIVSRFAAEGHSGFSASYAINILERLLRYEPLTPLTGEDAEWNDTGDCFQNKRCSYIFKDKSDGRAYNIQGIVFEDPDGCRYTGRDSRVYIDFPWSPEKPKIVKRDVDGNPVTE